MVSLWVASAIRFRLLLAPVRASKSLFVGDAGGNVVDPSPVNSTSQVVPDPVVVSPMVTGPATVRVPTLAPGLRVAPAPIVTAPLTVPVPPKVPPDAAVTAEVIDPFTSRVPALTVVGPV